MNRLFVFLLLMFCPLALVHGGGSKDGKIVIGFHLEGDANDNPKMIFPFNAGGQARVFSRTPEVSTRDLVSFGTFLADDQVNFGVVFQLRPQAATRFASIAAANQGKFLCASVNGKIVDAVQINEPSRDGFIVIWNGITETEIKQLDAIMPRIGKEKKK